MNYPLMRNNILKEDLIPVIDLLSKDEPKLTSGPEVLKFEQEWSEWLGCEYSVFVNSGSSANLLCLALLKELFPSGGKIVVPPFTWSSDISSLIWMGFEPLFVDIKLETLGLDSSQVIDQLKKDKEIVAIFITHAQGLNALEQDLINYIKENNIFLIEDVCESHGVRLPNGQKAGAFGDLSCFSFYYAHHMSTIEGGMICTNNESFYQTLRMLRSHGMLRESTNQVLKNEFVLKHRDLNPKFIFTRPAFNVRNNEIGAIIGRNQLKRLDQIKIKRAENFEKFLELMPNWVFKDFNLEGQSNYAFNLILKDPDKVLFSKLCKKFDEKLIEYRIGSAGGGNQIRQPYVKAFKNISEDQIKNLFPITDHVHFYGMYIGNFPDLDNNEISWLANIINNV
ncbi:putative CDP-4-keto-6-deoxy-D-glucose-3-dehydrase [Prochlorococcus marinus str. MIT 9107]|uniref:Putative CDP-4-keto-6-deoxy-D-glucose-3-dehydrase n=2 Tax=Prochlorococcaceae TaxID=2881426 RepID=A0A0A1ZUL8_PROMR|nr:putative CDP-4-keto-6-deoxy-D-glucose-3-dehydrase [Prochlorococcus marinus str. MIT 9107]KGF93065.1 putative CDP-4-keto-6-deoxy-D-glucose-3-dehydrase [Prochlorococcus marinus str. MIT 9116]